MFHFSQAAEQRAAAVSSKLLFEAVADAGFPLAVGVGVMGFWLRLELIATDKEKSLDEPGISHQGTE
jgi:hypothetical protein